MRRRKEHVLKNLWHAGADPSWLKMRPAGARVLFIISFFFLLAKRSVLLEATLGTGALPTFADLVQGRDMRVARPGRRPRIFWVGLAPRARRAEVGKTG